MDQLESKNELPAGVTLAQIQAAVDKSGYPLQTVVGRMMREVFDLQPEWGFFDRTTNAMRAIDLLAQHDLASHAANAPKQIRPHLVVPVECKRSELPYVFFSSEGSMHANFPHVAGLNHEHMSIKTDDDRSTWNVPVTMALGLQDDPFLISQPANCSTLSKCVRKGSEVELSGSDAYQGLVLPLRSAVEHFRRSAKPSKTAVFFDLHLIVGLAVLDAPMLSAETAIDGSTSMTFTPWQRLWRHEPMDESEFMAQRGEASAIDIVHKDFLVTYIRDHLLPFAQRFGARAEQHHIEIAAGRGFAKGMGADPFTDIEGRLRHR